MSRGIVALVVTSIAIVALQITVVSPLRVSGVVIMLVWLWPLALGLTGATLIAMFAGLCTGLLFDAHSYSPYGLSAVVGALLALSISLLAREGVGDLDGSAWWMPSVLLGVGGVLAPVLYVVVGTLSGHGSLWRASLLTTMALNAVAFVVLARPMARLAQRVAAVGGWARG